MLFTNERTSKQQTVVTTLPPPSSDSSSIISRIESSDRPVFSYRSFIPLWIRPPELHFRVAVDEA